MSISSLNMATVDVLGEESTFIQTIDKKIFNVGRDISSSGGNGADVLRKVPSVDVDIDGEVSIAGDANVTILLMEKGVEEQVVVDAERLRTLLLL